MNINRVTITGADDNIDISLMKQFSAKYPFLEWGILFTQSKIGEPRFPTASWRQDFAELKLRASAHFCGFFSRQILENQNFQLLTNYSKIFKRFQLNYNFKASKGYDLKPLLEFAKENPSIEIILQYNNSNKKVLDKYAKEYPSNIHFLYDSSGGRGIAMKEVGAPLFKAYTGYSGGITPDNVIDILDQIEEVPFNTNTWIDMEGGVRTDDVLDLRKVQEVLDTAEDYIAITE